MLYFNNDIKRLQFEKINGIEEWICRFAARVEKLQQQIFIPHHHISPTLNYYNAL
jgi:hypothetical protein